MTRRRSRGLTAAALVLGAALALSGCGSSSPPPATTHTPASQIYVALGDSYTAFPGTSSQISAVCRRSGQNYPHLLAAALGYRLIDVSCSGARTTDLTSSQSPGTAPQFSALNAATRLVTISIGANDLQLSTLLLGGCILFRNVPAAAHNPCELQTFAEATRGLQLLEPRLVTDYRAVRARAPHARVLVVGYPEILGISGTCSAFPLATGDVAYVNAINIGLNRAIQRAATTARVEFVDLARASMNHGICSRDPWINGITMAVGRAIPGHPFANEQRAVAQLLQTTLRP